MKKLLLIFLLPFSFNAGAQTKKLPDSLKQVVWAARLHEGFIFAHNVHVQDTKGTHPYGFELEYSHLRTDSATVDKYKCYPRSGLSFTFVNFNKELLGRSYSLSYFLEPNFRLGNNLKMKVKGSAGFSYLTNPFDSIKNPGNQSYSGHINSFLQLGIGLSYPLSKHFEMYAMGNFFHNSNGGFKLPNAGVNYVNVSLGLQYNTFSTKLPSYKKEKDTSWKHEPLHYDLSVYYSPKGGYNGTATNYTPSRKVVAGVSFQVTKRVSNLDAITANAEIYYDDALRSIKETFIADSSSSNVLAGILIGHQFLLNHFTFSQEFGIYIFKDTKKYNDIYQDLFHTFYQRWGLSYRIRKHWSIGVSLLAHYQVADYVDGRVIYRFR